MSWMIIVEDGRCRKKGSLAGGVILYTALALAEVSNSRRLEVARMFHAKYHFTYLCYEVKAFTTPAIEP